MDELGHNNSQNSVPESFSTLCDYPGPNVVAPHKVGRHVRVYIDRSFPGLTNS